MKQTIIFVILGFFMISCASKKTVQKAKNPQALNIDFLSDETIVRVPSKEKLHFKNRFTYTCHQKKFKQNFSSFLKSFPQNEKKS